VVTGPRRLAEIVSLRDPAEAPAWAIRPGKEFWSRPPSPAFAQHPGRAGAGVLPIRAADVVERVSHAFVRDSTGLGVTVEGGAYRASLQSDGLHFAPAHRGLTVSGMDSAALPAAPASDELRFRTRSIMLGDHMWSSDSGEAAEWQVLGNTTQALLDPASGLVEHYEARRVGVEVTWVVPRPPGGNGNLMIEAELTGLWSTRQTLSGVHLVDASGVARVKIGQAEAVDASGRRWTVSVRAAGEVVSVEVPGSVLARASYPLAIDPLISAEFGLDQPVEGPSPCTQGAPAAAAGPSGFLVAWTHGKGEFSGAGVYGARVSGAGDLLDPYGILLSTFAAEQTVCAVAADPGGFLVVWSAPHGASTTDWDILGTRVQPDGTVLDAPPLAVCSLAGSVQNSPAVAANGDGYLVVWRDSRSTGIYGTRLTAEGLVATTNGVPICTATKDQFSPAVAALGKDYLVVWEDYRTSPASPYQSDIYGARVAGDGTLVDTNGIALCTRTNSQFHPAVAGFGTAWLVAWEDYDVGGNDIVGTRVSADGTVLDPDGWAIAHASNAQANPVVAAADVGFLVAWQDHRQSSTNEFAGGIYTARVNDAGLVMDPDGLALSTAPGNEVKPALAARGDQALLVWQDSRNNPATTLADVYGARMDSISNALGQADFAVTRPANAEMSPAVAASGTEFLVVWADNRNGLGSGWDILGARVNQEGVLLDATAIPISTAANRQADPAVAASGTNYLVAWSDWRNTPTDASHADIYGSIVSAAGEVRQPDGLGICTVTNDQSLPALTALGTNFLVVWQDARNSAVTPARPDIYGARVTPEGVVLDPAGLAICTNTAIQTTPAVAASGSEALVVWTDFRNGSASDIYGARVGDDGLVVETNGIEVCRALGAQSAPAVAANGDGYFVAWTDARNGTANPDIYGATVTAAGLAQPADGFPIRAASGQQSAPAVVAQGPDYLVVWQEARSSASNSFDILGARVSPSGRGVSATLFLIDTNAFDQLAPAVTAGANGPCLVVNQGFRFSAPRTVASLFNQQVVPSLDSGVGSAPGPFQFRLRGAPGLRYAVESSEDAAVWTPRQTNLLTSDSVLITDEGAANLSWRFYRAVLLP
jgi:hypothetical protein